MKSDRVKARRDPPLDARTYRPRVGDVIHANILRKQGQHPLTLSRGLDETKIAAPLPEAFDLDRLAQHLRLDDDEAAWFSAAYLDELSRPEAQDRLSWSLQRADRVRKRLTRKLARYRRQVDRAAFDPEWFIIYGSSLRMCYEERLPSGARCWAMVQVDQGFETIMNAERADLFGHARPAKTKSIAA
ncbi:MAG: hypothetical protein JWO19_5234 [Bryobacterales bacterium]|nr:hypothetical protein [Bryobacterales bacterium]